MSGQLADTWVSMLRTLIETDLASRVVRSQRLACSITLSAPLEGASQDSIDVTLYRVFHDVVTGTLTETGDATLVFESTDASCSVKSPLVPRLNA